MGISATAVSTRRACCALARRLSPSTAESLALSQKSGRPRDFFLSVRIAALATVFMVWRLFQLAATCHEYRAGISMSEFL